jgi:putative peptide zinc metalloprotease protein
MWNKNSKVTLFDFAIHQDEEKFIVEEKHSGDFFEMSIVAVEAIKLLDQGKSIGETERTLMAAYPQEEIKMEDFISQLLELKFLKTIDKTEIGDSTLEKNTKGFLWIKTSVGKIYFNRFSGIVFKLSLLGSILLFILNPSLFPHYKDIFWYDFMFLNIILFASVSVFLVLIHEAGHILAARSYGIPVKLNIGHRLFFPVLESDVSSAWKLSRDKRNTIYLGGLSFDIVILFLSLVIQQYFLREDEGVFNAIITIVIFNICIRVLYQCCIYMKTDLYFVLENNTGLYNLMEEGLEYLKRKVIFSRKDDKKIGSFVKAFSVFYLFGISITIFLFLFYYIPQLLFSIDLAITSMAGPINTFKFWDGTVFLLQLSIVLFLLLFSWMRSLKVFFLSS